MREILFRGKRVDNGEWVVGNLIYRRIWETDICVIRVFDSGFDNYEEYDVIPETVGQYTGLTDKNGKKIFEGDIVKTQERYDRPYSKNRKSKRHIGVVEYQIHSGSGFHNSKTGKWDRYMEYAAEWIVKVQDYGKFTYGSWGDFWDCEVIGNIHDNPELLKGGAE